MTREDILRLADKVGMMPFAMAPRYQSQLAKQLGEFAALVAAAERDACAKLCEALGNDASIDEMEYRAFREADEAIRKRGEVKP